MCELYKSLWQFIPESHDQSIQGCIIEVSNKIELDVDDEIYLTTVPCTPKLLRRSIV